MPWWTGPALALLALSIVCGWLFNTAWWLVGAFLLFLIGAGWLLEHLLPMPTSRSRKPDKE